jgi:hypothetical protein
MIASDLGRWAKNMRAFIIGLIVGGICVSIPLGFKILYSSHHYKEYDSTFVGSFGKDKIQNVSFFEHTGPSLMEMNKWKVVMKQEYGDSIILYQRQPAFQESIPHRPVVEIEKDGIKIQDGEYSIRMIIEKMQTTEPNQAPETTILTVTDRAPSSTLRASEDRVSP